MKSLLITIVAIIHLLLLGCSQQTPTATITIKAVDETGKPIETVNISVGYQRSSPSGTKVHVEKGFTNSSGEFSSKAKTNGHVTFKAEKEGYYRSHGAHDFYKVDGSLIKSWGPSNPTINLILRKIMNPVPMYARNTSSLSDFPTVKC